MDPKPVKNRSHSKAPKAGRPTKADLAEQPPVRVEAYEVPQPPILGIRNPPCCRTAMIPRDRKSLGDGRYRARCGHCGARIIITTTNGKPVLVRKVAT